MRQKTLCDPDPNPELLRTAMEAAANAIFITDSEGVIEWANPSFERMTGYSVAEARGRTARILKSGQQSQGYYEDLWETVTSGRVWRGRPASPRKRESRTWPCTTI